MKLTEAPPSTQSMSTSPSPAISRSPMTLSARTRTPPCMESPVARDDPARRAGSAPDCSNKEQPAHGGVRTGDGGRGTCASRTEGERRAAAARRLRSGARRPEELILVEHLLLRRVHAVEHLVLIGRELCTRHFAVVVR